MLDLSIFQHVIFHLVGRNQMVDMHPFCRVIRWFSQEIEISGQLQTS